MEFFISISSILLHDPCPTGMNGLQETANWAKNHTYYIQQLMSVGLFVNNLSLPLPMMPQITVISTEFLFKHNGYLKDWPVT